MIARLVIAIMIVLNVVMFFKAFTVAIPFATKESYKSRYINGLCEAFGMNQKLAEAFYNAGMITEISPVLLASLAKTESNFDLHAKSYAYPEKYKGIMQTRNVDYDADIDVMRGAKHLQRDLKRVKDLQLAIALYKGGDNPVAHKQARQVIELYKEKKQIISQHING